MNGLMDVLADMQAKYPKNDAGDPCYAASLWPDWDGAGWNDGNNQINQWIVSANAINPLTNEPYSKQYWATYKEKNYTQMRKEWEAKFGAKEPAEYMQKNNIPVISPNVSVALPVDDNDVSLIRGQ